MHRGSHNPSFLLLHPSLSLPRSSRLPPNYSHHLHDPDFLLPPNRPCLLGPEPTDPKRKRVLRSKKGYSEISPKRISQAQKGNSSLAQSSRYRGNKRKAQRILKPRKRSIQKKKRTTAKYKKQGSSGTINRRGSLQAQRKRKTGTAR